MVDDVARPIVGYPPLRNEGIRIGEVARVTMDGECVHENVGSFGEEAIGNEPFMRSKI